MAPNMANTHAMPSTTTSTLHTGSIDVTMAVMMRRADWSRLKMRTTRKALSKRNVEITRMSKNGSRDIVVMHTMTKSNTLKALVQNFQNQLHTMFITSSIRKMTGATLKKSVSHAPSELRAQG